MTVALNGYTKYLIIAGWVGGAHDVSGGDNLTLIGTYGPMAGNGSTLRIYTATGGTITVPDGTSDQPRIRNVLVFGLH